jgi:hypothetical protein
MNRLCPADKIDKPVKNVVTSIREDAGEVTQAVSMKQMATMIIFWSLHC